MGNEFTGFEDNAPTLTLEPDLGESKAEIAAEPEAEAVKKEMEQTVLSPEEQQMVDSFAKKIDIENTNQILQYGAGTQKKMADFSDAALENVRTQDLGEVGELITQVVGELRDFDAAEEEKGFLGFFKKQGSKIENMKNRYAKAEVNVQKITYGRKNPDNHCKYHSTLEEPDGTGTWNRPFHRSSPGPAPGNRPDK